MISEESVPEGPQLAEVEEEQVQSLSGLHIQELYGPVRSPELREFQTSKAAATKA